MIFLDLEELVHVAARMLAAEPQIRDFGLLESALARPQASAFGRGAYRGIHEKAAALLHSFARSHALVDGNKRLALAATIAFCGMNGCASRSGMGPKGPGPTEIQALAQLAVDLLDPLCKLSLRQSVQLWADVEDAVAHRVGCLGDDRGRSADVAPGVPLAYAIEHVTD